MAFGIGYAFQFGQPILETIVHPMGPVTAHERRAARGFGDYDKLPGPVLEPIEQPTYRAADIAPFVRNPPRRTKVVTPVHPLDNMQPSPPQAKGWDKRFTL